MASIGPEALAQMTPDQRVEAYKARAQALGIITGGRLADYRYYNMDQTIGAALAQVGQLLGV